jgi:hypothetical protein
MWNINVGDSVLWCAKLAVLREPVCAPRVYSFCAICSAASQRKPKPGKNRLTRFDFALGEWHPVYDALRNELSPNRKPYAYFVRMPDLPAFLAHIAPLLNRRLAAGVMAGYTGSLRLNFFPEQWALEFETGEFSFRCLIHTQTFL